MHCSSSKPGDDETMARTRVGHSESQPTRQQVRRALARAERGAALDVDEAAVLLAATGADLDRLTTVAARVRDAGLVAARRPGVVTYSPKVFIPITKLCRDRCHYCTFVETPGQAAREGREPFLSPDEILEIASQGAAMGCLEALFTLGDRPEDRWPEAREWLDEQGYDSTLAYVRAMAVRVLEETGLLPHLNPGVMSWEELNRLKPVSPSMGMMLETFASVGRTDLFAAVDTEGRTDDRRSDFANVYGDWNSVTAAAATTGTAAVLHSEGREALAAAEADPGNLSDQQALTLMTAEGPLLEQVCRLADDLRRESVGGDVTYVVNRNINFTNVCYSAAASARSPSAAPTLTPTPSPSTRSPTAQRRPGGSAPPRSACRAGSTPSSPRRRTSTWCAR